MLRQARSATQCVESELRLRTQRSYRQTVGVYRCCGAGTLDKATPLYICNHSGVQIPPKHIMWSIQENDFDFSSGFFRPLDVYDRSLVLSI